MSAVHSFSTVAANSSRPGQAFDRHLLFVNASVSAFRQIEDDLREAEPSWHVQFAPAPAGVDAALKSAAFDAVVVDADVAEAAQLFQSLEQAHPRLLRVVVSCPETSANTPLLKRPGVKVVSKCPEAASLADQLKSLLQVRDWLADPFISKLMSRIKKLPTLPKLHSQVTAELQSPDGSLEAVAEHVRRDPVMTAKFLHVANSAYYARASSITDPGEAVMFLGAETTRSLILMAGVFSQFDGTALPGFSSDQLWDHSLQVGSLARGITLVETEDPKQAESAYTAGLLHDVGRLVLAANVPTMYATAQQLQQNKQIPWHEAEAIVFSTTHGELGACLLGSWGLPYDIIEATAWHHRPALSKWKGFSILAAVHVADVIARQTGHASRTTAEPAYFDSRFLESARLNTRVSVWREACGIPPLD